jgi:YYY domain-containing protein
MASFFVWWAAAELLAFAAVPLAFRLLRFLPDRGYTAAKPLGLLLATFLFWFCGALGLIGNDHGSILLITFVLLLLGLLLAALQRRALVEFVGTNARYLLIVEGIFLVIFAWFALLRAYAPDILATEKQFELAYLNGVSRSPFFPPTDPWFSGHFMNYYYFGWVGVDFLDRLTQTSNAIGFNLGTPLTAALAAVTIFGLVYGLVRALSNGAGNRRAILFGLFGVLALLFISNLEGVLELLAAHQIGSAGFYNAIGVDGLTAGKTSNAWFPTEFWFWWRATRMGSGYNIMEFPFFSLLLGDLHPHVMTIPFALLGLVFGWNLLAGDQALDGHWWKREPLYLIMLGILLGAFAVLNAWDQPAAFVILFLIALVANRRRMGAFDWPAIRASVLFVVPVAVLALLLYLPYWGVLQSSDITGLSAILVTSLPPNPARDSMATPPLHLLLFWGPFFWLTLSFLIVHMRRTRAFSLPAAYTLVPLALAVLPLLVWAAAVAGHTGLGGLAGELSARGGGLLTELILVLMLYLNLAALMREAIPAGERKPEPAVLFTLICSTVAVLWILGAELFYVVESSFSLRYNTVFKLWYQAWEFEALASAVGLAYVLREWRMPALALRPSRLAWSAATALLLAAALVYPVIATANRSNGFKGPLTLDGLAFFQRAYPSDYAAGAWLAANAGGTPVVLEAEGGQLAGNFSAEGARISELTGLPTVLGWLGHEQIHYGFVTPLDQRSQDIKTIYTTSDPIVAHSLLQHYGVKYVVVGDLERRVYGDTGLLKFPQMGAAVYRAPGLTIYDVTQAPTLATAPGLPAGP